MGLILILLAMSVGMVNLASGDIPLPFADVLRTLIGQGDPGAEFIVLDLRLPRVAVGLLAGAALGVSGAVFQSLTRNPLGSPDFVGLTVGAATGALLAILVFNASGLSVAASAIVGCMITSVLIYLLAFRDGVQPFRLILMGIGVSALLEAFNSFLILRARIEDAVEAQVWQIGSVGGRDLLHVAIVGVPLLVVLPLILRLGRSLTMMRLGDETAALQGVPVERDRALLALGAVVLAAASTAAAGPVSFVALAAPHLAARLSRGSGPGVLPAAAMGALLMTGSDWVAQRILPDQDVPVGVVTAAVGGAYLTWLLVAEWRRGRRG
ncbi:FecCD family ABC transporter permease [Actinoplanes couchii]|uniref:ABC transporter permease n=1 Tax=Actinoplanes couchii TaxID=403638 RepID=A0ABQ3XKR6_9ACTN|nr:iron chelate uptake ABC transporter family permease subunit [Actinoplanes couchii]MDR6319512.1 iron complex transport system permease protein [Actinoplanes couchii]GID59099.1 ABC transporter permease [Actinoplanes couchii]